MRLCQIHTDDGRTIGVWAVPKSTSPFLPSDAEDIGWYVLKLLAEGVQTLTVTSEEEFKRPS